MHPFNKLEETLEVAKKEYGNAVKDSFTLDEGSQVGKKRE